MTTAQDGAPTADEAFGFVINSAMFRQRVSQKKLAAALKCHPTTLGKKLHGERPWALEDMIAVADALRLDLRDLLGEMWGPAGGPLAQSVELQTFNLKSGLGEIAKVIPLRPRKIPQDLSFVAVS